MSAFGWRYPPGTAYRKDAPWNEIEVDEDEDQESDEDAAANDADARNDEAKLED